MADVALKRVRLAAHHKSALTRRSFLFVAAGLMTWLAVVVTGPCHVMCYSAAGRTPYMASRRIGRNYEAGLG